MRYSSRGKEVKGHRDGYEAVLSALLRQIPFGYATQASRQRKHDRQEQEADDEKRQERQHEETKEGEEGR